MYSPLGVAAADDVVAGKVVILAALVPGCLLLTTILALGRRDHVLPLGDLVLVVLLNGGRSSEGEEERSGEEAELHFDDWVKVRKETWNIDALGRVVLDGGFLLTVDVCFVFV